MSEAGLKTKAAEGAVRENAPVVPRPRGRPRAFNPEIATARAQELFLARGYDRVTLNDLTGAMGINPPSFYAAFGNKALLFTRIADIYSAEWLAEVRGAFEREAQLIDALEAILLLAARRFAWRESASGPWGGCMILEAASNCSDAGIVGHLRKARLSIAAALYRGVSRHAPERVVDVTDHIMMLLAGLSAIGRDGTSVERLVAVAKQAARALALESEATQSATPAAP
jgi:TetR/AcrR family transcriptional repressor for divergent bdcA